MIQVLNAPLVTNPESHSKMTFTVGIWTDITRKVLRQFSELLVPTRNKTVS